jgi:phage terminase small subunit
LPLHYQKQGKRKGKDNGSGDIWGRFEGCHVTPLTEKVKKMISDKMMAAIEAYFDNGFNKKDALLTAGYAKTTATNFPSKVFGREDVKAEIEARKMRRAQRHDVNQDWVISRFMKLAMSGETLAKFKKVQEDGSLGWDFTGATEEELAVVTELGVDYYTEGRGNNAREVKKFRVKHPDMQAALVALARHLGLFNDSLEVTSDVSEKIAAGRARARLRDKESDPDTVH